MTMTMKELARLAGVSRPAVSAVLNNLTTARVSPKTRETILRLADEYDFVPNLAARQLNGAPSCLIGLLAVASNIGFVAVLQTELIKILQNKGFEVMINQFSLENAKYDSEIRDLRARRAEGIIALNMPCRSDAPANTVLPIVYLSASNMDKFDITTDREWGGYLAGKHLMEHGRKHPVYISFGEHSFPNQEKCKGFSDALKEYGCSYDGNILKIKYGIKASDVVKEIVKLKADSIFCCNDYVGVKIINALVKAGCKVPDDVAVIGFDGYAFCDFTSVPMATIVQPVKKQAELAVDLLIERMSKKSRETAFFKQKLKPVLRPAASCGCTAVDCDHISGIDNVLLDAGIEEINLKSRSE